MGQELTDIIQAVTSMLSVIIAVLAVVIAVRTERRAQKRFESGLNLQEKRNAASIKPLIAVFTSEFTNNKGIVLSNAGAGTAVITAIAIVQAV